jgi:hypothetical protein
MTKVAAAALTTTAVGSLLDVSWSARAKTTVVRA